MTPYFAKFTPKKANFFWIPHSMIPFSLKSYTECPPISFPGRHIPVTFIFECPLGLYMCITNRMTQYHYNKPYDVTIIFTNITHLFTNITWNQFQFQHMTNQASYIINNLHKLHIWAILNDSVYTSIEHLLQLQTNIVNIVCSHHMEPACFGGKSWIKI